jgi:hypothetical protein
MEVIDKPEQLTNIFLDRLADMYLSLYKASGHEDYLREANEFRRKAQNNHQ